MIPVGNAFESSGAAAQLTQSLVSLEVLQSPVVMLAAILVVTMCLSDVLNNAAAAIVMCPVAIGLASHLHVSPDAYLMAVAIGASCAFLTPIGHQSNTLVLGPGGYRFGDYVRCGAPLELLIAAIAIPLLLWAWPLLAIDTAVVDVPINPSLNLLPLVTPP